MKIKLNFFGLYLPIAFLVLAIIGWYGSVETQSDLDQVRHQELHLVGLGAAELNRSLEFVTQDLIFLSKNLNLQDAINSPAEENLNHAKVTLAAFSKSKTIYDQIRWIDETGMEKLRVNRVNGEVLLVMDDKLQNKRNRYYFRDAMKLNPGEIYISPFDLNTELGEIERPNKPTIRVGTPVIDSMGRKRGILILNYLGEHLLNTFAETTSEISGHINLLNKDGYWLKSPIQSDEWGFMFNRADLSFSSRYPEAWAQIRLQEKGQMEIAEGILSWSTVYPLTHQSNHLINGPDMLSSGSRNDKLQQQYVWISLALLSNAVIDELILPLQQRLIWLAVSLLLLTAVGSWKLVNAWTAQSQSEEALRLLNSKLEAKVKASTKSLREAQRIGKMGDWQYDYQDERLSWSEEVFRIFEVEPEAFNGNYDDFLSLIHPDDRDDVDRTYNNSIEKQEPYEIDHRILMKDGRVKWVHERGETVFDAYSQPVTSYGIVQDVTHSRLVIEALRVSEERFRDIAQISADWIWEVDADGRYTYVSKSVHKLLGYSPEDLLGKTPFDLMSSDEAMRVGEQFARIVKAKAPFKDLENVVLGKDGSANITLTNGMPIMDNNGDLVGYRGVDRDVTRYRKMEAEVQKLAFYDALTNLPNRRLLFDRLTQSIADGKRNDSYGALLFLDLDNFKPLNDQYGHAVGDLLLIEAANRLKLSVREIDTVARFGGDEFVVILNSLNVNLSKSRIQAKIVSEKIIESLSKPYQIPNTGSATEPLIEHHCTASIGVVVFRFDIENQETILKWADIAMYEAKKVGGNSIHFFDND